MAGGNLLFKYRIGLSFALFLLLTLGSLAQNTLTWTGGGATDNWSDANNWGGVGIPNATNNILVFGGSTRLTPVNDIAGLTIRQIQFAAGASAFTLSGNAFTLGDTAGSANALLLDTNTLQTINNDLTFGRNQTWDRSVFALNNLTVNGAINNSGYTLTSNLITYTFNGVISGTGGFVKNATGFAYLNANNTYTGLTTVNAGWLYIYGTIAGDALAPTGGRIWGFNGTINGNLTLSGFAGDALAEVRKLTVNGDVTVGGGAFNTYTTFTLDTLTDIGTGVAGTDWSLLSLPAGGDLTYLNNSLISIYVNNFLDPDSGDPFWNSSHLWLAGDLSTGTLDRTGLLIDPTYNTWGTGNFGLLTLNGNDLYVYWNPVPEPSTWVMLAIGAGLLLLRKRQRKLAYATTLIILSAAVLDLRAQNTLTWNGGGADSNWSTSGNWGGAGIPDATNDILIFNGPTQLINVNDLAGLSLRALTMNGSSAAWNLSGNDITLGEVGGPSTTLTFASSTLFGGNIYNNITLGKAQTWSRVSGGSATFGVFGNVDNNGFDLTLDLQGANTMAFVNSVSGSGGLVINGSSGIFQLTGNHTYTGLTTQNGGTMQLNGSLAGSVNSNGFTLAVSGSSIGGDVQMSTSNGFLGTVILSIAGNLSATTSSAVSFTKMTIGGDVLFDSSTFAWNLGSAVDQGTGTAGTNWSEMIVQNFSDATFTNNSAMNLSFFSNPDGGNPFWNSSHLWLVSDLESGTLDRTGLSIANAGWGTGNFGLLTLNGNDLYMYWNPVPEPSTWAMLAIGAGMMGIGLARRRGRSRSV